MPNWRTHSARWNNRIEPGYKIYDVDILKTKKTFLFYKFEQIIVEGTVFDQRLN